MNVKTAFKVISNAPFLAGERSMGAGQTIELTEEQARYPLIMGEIELLKSVPEGKKIKG